MALSPSFMRYITPKSLKKTIRKHRSVGSIPTGEEKKAGFDLDSISLNECVKLASLNLAPPENLYECPYPVVAAIDFGTTYSGYAYAFSEQPDNIHLMRRTESNQPGVDNYKVPCILLLNENGELDSFGNEARERYHDMEEEKAKNCFYLEKFKLALHFTEHLHRDLEIRAANGRSILATTVFAHAMRHFGTCCLQELQEQTNFPVAMEDIQWVITVPAIWRQSAKQFMRHAALQAGLITADNPDQLIIALEPEAASIYCKTLKFKDSSSASSSPILKAAMTPPESNRHYSYPGPSSPPRSPMSSSCSSSQSSLFSSSWTPPASKRYGHSILSIGGRKKMTNIHPGTKYMVADCGGGTIDLTVHEMEHGGYLKELQRASGGPWGSTSVDQQFELLLGDIFGREFITHYKCKNPLGWIEVMVGFEAKKRLANTTKQFPVNISLPFSFIEQFKKFSRKTVEQAIENYDGVCKDISWSPQGMLRLHPEALLALFNPPLTTIIHDIISILQKPELMGIEYLFIVGGFAESQVLQDRIHKVLASEVKCPPHVIVPQDTGLTTLKGAVMYGLNPTIVRVRRSAMSYGVGILNKFIPGIHPEAKKVLKGGQAWCNDIFDTYVLVDQPISYGETVTRSYTTAQNNLQSTVITICASQNETVHFVTDPGVKKVCELKLLMLGNALKGQPRELKLTMMFGNTEITIQATDHSTGQTAKVIADFLYK